MKRLFLLLTALILMLSLISCEDTGNERVTTDEGSGQPIGTTLPSTTTAPPTECVETFFLYVKYVGEDGFIGENVGTGEMILVLCDTSDIGVFNTIRVDVAESKILEESGERISSSDPFVGETYGYNRVIREPISIRRANPSQDEPVAEKPVIYLYPESETEVSVKLDFDGKLLITDPVYGDGWRVTASPDGILTTADGKTYPYLFWEGQIAEGFAITKGFCVPGAETEAFLREMLPKLGLIPAEYEEFIEFWLPRMEGNAYNLIRFCEEDYTDRAKLTVTPEPDSVIRVFMAFRGSDAFVDLPAQTIETPTRQGFVLVEWGGCELPE